VLNDEDVEALTASDFLEIVRDMVPMLKETRRRADDRDAQYNALCDVAELAELDLPTGFGPVVDKAAIKPKAAAMLLVRELQRAQKHVPIPPGQLDTLIAAIDRLTATLPAVEAALQLVVGFGQETTA
jgi:hypothetical protein